MDNEDCASESVLHGNDAFVHQLITRKSSSERSPRTSGYFCDEHCVVPFIWEEKPGIPKDPPTQHFVPPIIPPPAKQTPMHGPKPVSTQPRSCFLRKPWRSPKPKKIHMVLQEDDQHHVALEEYREFGQSEISPSDDDMVSSPRVSKSLSSSSARDSPASSKGFGTLAKGILRRFF